MTKIRKEKSLMNEFKFELEPGKKINKQEKYKKQEPIISVIVPFFNSKNYIEQTIMSNTHTLKMLVLLNHHHQ